MNSLSSWLKRKPFLNSFIGFLTLFLMFTSAERAHADCKVKNDNTGVVYHDLQTAINAASSGDTLLVKGKCETSVGFTIVDKSLTIKGRGKRNLRLRRGHALATLDGNYATTVLTITESVPDTVFVKLENLKIENGNGGIGGGINNNATLTIVDSEIVYNHAFAGGGIASNVVFTVEDIPTAGSLTVIRSRIGHNTASFVGGGISSAGDLTRHAIVNIQHSEIHDNAVEDLGRAGGIDILNADLFMTHSEIHHNRAAFGGGLANGNGLAILKHSKIDGNTATNRGGGIINFGSEEGTTLVVESSKVRNNLAVFEGGGLYNATATATFTDSLIKENKANNGGGIFNEAGSTLNLIDTPVIDNIPNEVVDF